MLRVISSVGTNELARVFVGTLDDGSRVEFVESVQPPIAREEKWVLIVSTLKGCPVGCPICDAGMTYRGKLSSDQIMAQIDHLVRSRYADGVVPVKKLKVQFARMGDPAFNDAVLDVLRRLPRELEAPGLLPCVSTIAPAGRDDFFAELTRVKKQHYTGRFQMQFSLHTTDERLRRELVPISTWSFQEMAGFGTRFLEPGDRKITLNFATPAGYPLEPEVLRRTFDPESFLVKLTPVNPTVSATANGLDSLIEPGNLEAARRLEERFRSAGYETVLSIGEPEENRIGSNCGMYVGAKPEERRRAC